MHSLSLPFFFNINSIRYPTDDYNSLICPNLRFSYMNSFSAWCSILVSLYIKKNLRLVFSSRLII